MAKGTIAGRILKMLVGAMAGGMASAGGFGGGAGIASRILGGAGGGGGPAPGTQLDYPDRNQDFIYNVAFIPGPAQFNAQFDGNRKPMRMQTLDMHNRALNKYIRPGQNPLERRAAIERGIQEEKQLEEFWTDDVKPRNPDSRSSSSAVSGVRILPDNNIAIQFGGKGKWYTYRGGPTPYEAALEAHDLVTAPSLGRSMNRFNPASWGAKHKLF